MRVQDMLGIQFHGGNICYAWLPDPNKPLEEQRDQLDRCLVEVFYPLGFLLEVGYYDETGLADGHYPDGEFRVTLRASPSRVLVQEWRTRDIQTLYRQVREAARLAPKLRQKHVTELATFAPSMRVRTDD